MLHYGWRSSFWACAIIGLIAGAVWYLMARDEPAEHPYVSASELETIRSGLPRESGMAIAACFPGELCFGAGKCARSQPAIFVSATPPGFSSAGFLSTWPRSAGLNLKASAFYAMLPPVAMSVCSFSGRRHQRRAHEVARPAPGTLRPGRLRHRTGRNIYRLRLPGCQRSGGQPGARGRCGGPLLVTEFVLVGERRHCRQGIRFGFRLHEHGGADWRSSHCVTDARNCRALRLDCVLSCGCGAVSRRSGGMADG